MKKVLIILMSCLVCSTVFADVVTTRKLNQTTSTSTTTSSTTTKKLAENVKTCSPYSENAQFDVSGVNFIFNIKIAGWVNNKCRMDFTSNTNGISSNFKDLYGIDSSQAEILAFAPKFRCEFTKQQLSEVGDAILEENSRQNGGKMLKNPNNLNISMSQLSQNDSKILSYVLDGRTCVMLNSGDLNNIINSLF